MKICGNCGKPIQDGDVYCPACGSPVSPQLPISVALAEPSSAAERRSPREVLESIYSSVANAVLRYFGSDGVCRLKVIDLFSGINKRHSREEAEDLFISGTYRTTPKIEELTGEAPKPWLYSRILFCMVVAYIFMLVCVTTLKNNISLAGLIFLGSFAMPFAILMLFFELNTFRNISFYTVLKLFFMGGAASLVITLVIFSLDIIHSGHNNFWSAFMTGVGEELGKAFIVFYFLRRMRDCNYILQGMLVGAVIGAGFAALESAGYAMHALTSVEPGATRQSLIDAVTASIYTRGFLSPGSHVAWAAITGAAFMIAKGQGRLSFIVFQKVRFWKLFIIPVLFHACWNAPFLDEPGAEDFIKYSTLVGAVWLVLLILINMGLSQVAELRSNPSVFQTYDSNFEEDR